MNAEQRSVLINLIKVTHGRTIDDARKAINDLHRSLPTHSLVSHPISMYLSSEYVALGSEGHSFSFYLEKMENVRQTWMVIDPTSEHYNNNWLRDIAETCNEMNTILDSSPEQWYRYPKESITSPALDSIGSKTKWFCWRRVGGMIVPQDDVWR